MTKVSRIPLEKEIRKDLLAELWWTLDSLRIKEVLAFLAFLFTPTETVMLAKRLAILRALRKKIDYSSIRESFKVSDITIAKMSNLLHKADTDFLRTLDKLIREEERRWEDYKERRKKAGGVKGGGRIFPRKLREDEREKVSYSNV